MTFSTKLLAGALVFAALSPSAAVRADDVRQAVDAGNRAFIAAFLRDDARAVADLYTEDAQVIAPGAPGRPRPLGHRGRLAEGDGRRHQGRAPRHGRRRVLPATSRPRRAPSGSSARTAR